MDSKLSQKGWQNVVIWVGLVAASMFTSNSMVSIFGQITNILGNALAGDIANLFADFKVLFVTILTIVLLFLIIMVWLNLVSYTYDVIDIVFAAEEEVEETSYPTSVLRYLAFTWGLFYLIFLIIPVVL